MRETRSSSLFSVAVEFMKIEVPDIIRSATPSSGTSRILGAHPLGSRWIRWIAAAVLIIGGLVLGGRKIVEMNLPPIPSPPDVPIRETIWDGTPIWFTITRNWKRLPFVAPVIAIRSDETLWLQMYLRNWDTVPLPFRVEAVDAMLVQYQHLIANPRVWDTMQAKNWDLVPQPVRALSFGHMTEYWNGYYDVGVRYEIPRRHMADTLHAIIMAESWFEHRAVSTSVSGNRDFGAAQASDYARQRMRSLYRAGSVDVQLNDDDYFNPWIATRFLAIWMNFMLDEVGGDLDLAVQAYHSGSSGARNGEGIEYLASVKRYRRFLRTPPDTAPTWKYLITGDWETNHPERRRIER